MLTALTWFVCFAGYFNTLCVLAALTWFVCCFAGYFNTLCVLFNSKSSVRVQPVSVYLPKFNTCTACVVLFEHIMLVVSKQHAESVVPNLQAAQTLTVC